MQLLEKEEVFAIIENTHRLLVLGLRVDVLFADWASVRDDNLVNLFKTFQRILHSLIIVMTIGRLLLLFALLRLLVFCERVLIKVLFLAGRYYWRKLTILFLFNLLFEYSYGLQDIYELCLVLHFFDSLNNHEFIVFIRRIIFNAYMTDWVLQTDNFLGFLGLKMFSWFVLTFLVFLKLYELEHDVLGLLMQAIFHLFQSRFDGCQVAQTQNPLENWSNFQLITVHFLSVFEVRNKFLPQLLL